MMCGSLLSNVTLKGFNFNSMCLALGALQDILMYTITVFEGIELVTRMFLIPPDDNKWI